MQLVIEFQLGIAVQLVIEVQLSIEVQLVIAMPLARDVESIIESLINDRSSINDWRSITVKIFVNEGNSTGDNISFDNRSSVANKGSIRR